MFDKNKVDKDYNNYTMVELIYMVSLKCRSRLNSSRGCTDCEFLDCHDECCLNKINEDFLPADWRNIDVERGKEEDYYAS